MYTDRNVSRLLRPLALCVALMIGAAPAAATICELLCAAPIAVDGEQTGTHHHGHHDGHGVAQASGDHAAVKAINSACDPVAVQPATIQAGAKLSSPSAATGPESVAINFESVRAVPYWDVRTTGPPGLSARPLALRI